jgi:hypothetical protein
MVSRGRAERAGDEIELGDVRHRLSRSSPYPRGLVRPLSFSGTSLWP